MVEPPWYIFKPIPPVVGDLEGAAPSGPFPGRRDGECQGESELRTATAVAHGAATQRILEDRCGAEALICSQALADVTVHHEFGTVDGDRDPTSSEGETPI
jgi:hypothetical protein